MARFFGRYEHSLDAKGRVILPAKFRAAFEHGGYLTNFSDRCLALWTPEDFEGAYELVRTGRARPVVDEVLPLEAIRAAHERLEAGDQLGKIVLRIGD